MISLISSLIVVGAITTGIYYLFEFFEKLDKSSASGSSALGSSTSEPSIPPKTKAPSIAPEIVLFGLNLCGADVEPAMVAGELQVWTNNITSGGTVKQESCATTDQGRGLLSGGELDFSIITKDQAARSAFETAMKNTDAGTAFKTFLMDKACTEAQSTRLCQTAQIVVASIDFVHARDEHGDEVFNAYAACEVFLEETLINVKSTWLANVDVSGGELGATAFAMHGGLARFPWESFGKWDSDVNGIISEDELRAGLRSHIAKKNLCPGAPWWGAEADSAEEISMTEFLGDYRIMPVLPNIPVDHEVCISFSNMTGKFEEEMSFYGGTWKIKSGDFGSFVKLGTAYLIYRHSSARVRLPMIWQSGKWRIGNEGSSLWSQDYGLGLVSGAQWHFGESIGEITVNEGACVGYPSRVCVSKESGNDKVLPNIEGTYNSRGFEKKWYSDIGEVSINDLSGEWIFTATSDDSESTTMNLGDHNYSVGYGRCVPQTMCVSFVDLDYGSGRDYTFPGTFTAQFQFASVVGETNYVYLGIRDKDSPLSIYHPEDKKYKLQFVQSGRPEAGQWTVTDANTGSKIAEEYVENSDVFAAFNHGQWYANNRPTTVDRCD